MEQRSLHSLEHIPIRLDAGRIGRKLQAERTGDWDGVRECVETAAPLIQPRACFRADFVESREVDTVMIDGVSFRSRVLGKNLDQVERVFPFLITIGPELEASIDATEDILLKYYLDVIGNVALNSARIHLEKHLRAAYGFEKISAMSPGSLPDWPIEEQKKLFSLLGETWETMGVRLEKSLLMIPRKSVSGIYFPSHVTFFSCRLCPRERCEGRKAPYDEALAREYGVATEADS
jgi:hypothetical protein